MRSSKSRSRSKQNRPRTLGNIINRVFDSSGPEGKVRGTPQQIIEKYQLLARDAQLSNDRVAAENFLQHAEHYTRLLAEANREMAAEQEARQQYQQQNGNGNGNGNSNAPPRDREWRDNRDEQPYVAYDGGDEAGLVDLPETNRPRQDQQRGDQPRGDQPRYDRNRNDRNSNDRSYNDRQNSDRQNADRQNSDRQNADRQNSDRQQGSERQYNDRPRDDRPRDDRPREDRPRQDNFRNDRNRNQNQNPANQNAAAEQRPREDRKPDLRFEEPAAAPVVTTIPVVSAVSNPVAALMAEAVKPEAPAALAAKPAKPRPKPQAQPLLNLAEPQAEAPKVVRAPRKKPVAKPGEGETPAD